MKTNLAFLLALLSSFFLSGSLALGQGSLTPPAAPTPTMKTLDQIEARIPIDATHTPGNAGNQYIINQSGSYYLTGNITGVSGKNGISIQSDNVTVDLNGFALINSAASPGTGIVVPADNRNISIRNGTIRGWNSGVDAAGTGTKNVSIERIYVSDNQSDGIKVDFNSAVMDCAARSNGGNGFSLFTGSLISHCTATSNTNGIYDGGGPSVISECYVSQNSQNGIYINGGVVRHCVALDNTQTGINSFNSCSIQDCESDGNMQHGFFLSASASGTITNCTANFNGTGTTGFGIQATNGVTIEHCVVSMNKGGGIDAGLAARVDGCTVYKNSGVMGGAAAFGISVSDSSTVSNNTLRENDGDAIRITAGCQALNNTCDYNGRVVTGASNILVSGPQNRIEGNNVTSNLNSGFGIKLTSGGNIILKNSAKINTTNYSIVANNRYGPVVDLTAPNPATVNGNSAAGTASTDPWANVAY